MSDDQEYEQLNQSAWLTLIASGTMKFSQNEAVNYRKGRLLAAQAEILANSFLDHQEGLAMPEDKNKTIIKDAITIKKEDTIPSGDENGHE